MQRQTSELSIHWIVKRHEQFEIIAKVAAEQINEVFKVQVLQAYFDRFCTRTAIDCVNRQKRIHEDTVNQWQLS